MLSSPERRKDPHNHAVPILDHFTKGTVAFLVMPLLRLFNDPPFSTVNEVVDFFRQMLQVMLPYRSLSTLTHPRSLQQGLKYLHDLNVAHRYLTLLLLTAMHS
jgi:serine/threonine protein kinase